MQERRGEIRRVRQLVAPEISDASVQTARFVSAERLEGSVLFVSTQRAPTLYVSEISILDRPPA
jgi:hypothetical protein